MLAVDIMIWARSGFGLGGSGLRVQVLGSRVSKFLGLGFQRVKI